MKQYIKRVLLVLCMTVSLFSLSACSASTEPKGKELDPMMEMAISQSAEGLMQSIAALDEAQAMEMEASFLAEDQFGLASGVTSWLGVMKDTGAFVGVISSETEIGADDEYVSTIVAQFENRNVEFKMFSAEDGSGQGLMPTSISFTPEYTFGEKMEKAAMNTLLGMGTVFVVLIFISFIIAGLKFVNVFETKMKNKQAAETPAPVAEAAPVVEEEELVDDLELVAVITAAIAASTNSSTDGLVVRSIKRAPGAKWKRA